MALRESGSTIWNTGEYVPQSEIARRQGSEDTSVSTGLDLLGTLAQTQAEERGEYESRQKKAEAAGLEELAAGYDKIVAEASKHGNNTEALWKGIDSMLEEQAAKAKAAIEAGYDPEAVRKAYEAGIATIEDTAEQVTGIYEDLGAEIDAEMERAPYDERKRLSLMKEAISQPLQEHLKRTQDYMQRTGSQGSMMPRSRELMQEAIEGMVPFVGDQITAAQEAREGMLGRKQDLGTWYSGQRVGLGRNLAELEVGKGERLSELGRWKGEKLAGIETGLGSDILSARTAESRAQEGVLDRKTAAMEKQAQARGEATTAMGKARAAKRAFPTDYSPVMNFVGQSFTSAQSPMSQLQVTPRQHAANIKRLKQKMGVSKYARTSRQLP